MTVRDMLELIRRYTESGDLNPDAEVAVRVWGAGDVSDTFPASTVTGQTVAGRLLIHAEGDTGQRHYPPPACAASRGDG
jgi:hypothetical protein